MQKPKKPERLLGGAWAQSGMLLPPAAWANLWCWGQSGMPAPCCLGQSVVLGPVWDAPGQSVALGPIWDASAPCCLSQSVVLGPIWDALALLSGSVCGAAANLGCSLLLPRPICGVGACLGCLEHQSWMLNSRCNQCATNVLWATGYAVQLLLEATGVH